MPAAPPPPMSIASFAGLVQPAAAVKVTPPSSWTERASPLATNLAEVGPFGTDPMAVNWFKEAEAWVGGAEYNYNRSDPVDVDERGEIRSLKPGQYAKALACNNTLQHFPGVYSISWIGVGEVEVVAGTPQQHEPNLRVHSVRPDQGPSVLGICVKSADPKNPPRQFKIFRHNENAQRPDFHVRSEFIDRITSVYSGLRFMDWARVNGWSEEVAGKVVKRRHPVASWSDRAQVGDATWATHKGVPWEVAIELCNRTGLIPYINVPHTYSLEMIHRLAALWHQRLHPSMPLYTAHSNEVWNDQFPQHDDCAKDGALMNLGSNPIDCTMRYHALRTADVASAFNSNCPGRRVSVVLEGQFSVPSRYKLMLDFLSAHLGRGAAALGITHLGSGIYFGNDLGHAQLPDPDKWPAIKDPDWGKKIDAMTPEQIVELLLTQYVPGSIAIAKAEAALAKSHGLRYTAYEAGQHVCGVNERIWDMKLAEKFMAVNRSPDMAKVNEAFLRGLQDAGVERPFLFTHTTPYSNFGSWGSLEGQWQRLRAAPKRMAIAKVAGKPKWW